MTRRKLLPIAFLAALTTCSAAAAQEFDQEAALAHAQCMRDNGYAEFPDPTPEGGMRFRVTPESASRFEAASAACRDLAPEGLRGDGITPEDLEALLSFSQCVRENGLPDFPDPNADGSFDSRRIGSGPDDPKLRAAMDACRNESGGGLRIMIGG